MHECPLSKHVLIIPFNSSRRFGAQRRGEAANPAPNTRRASLIAKRRVRSNRGNAASAMFQCCREYLIVRTPHTAWVGTWDGNHTGQTTHGRYCDCNRGDVLITNGVEVCSQIKRSSCLCVLGETIEIIRILCPSRQVDYMRLTSQLIPRLNGMT